MDAVTTVTQAAPPPWPFVGLQRWHYRVILVDAPLKFSSGPNRNPKNHYRTMSLAEIRALPVRELAHPDGARLILWITMPWLYRMHVILDAWDFRYSSARPWMKLWPREDGLILYPDSFSVAHGYEVRNSSELQVIAKRGRPQRLGNKKLRGLIIAAGREHSRKPDCVRDELAELLDGPRCELFARSRHPGFESWGDEVERFDDA